MKNNQEKQSIIKLKFKKQQIDNSIQNTTFCVPDMNYNDVEKLRRSIFSVCKSALSTVLDLDSVDEKDNKIFEVMNLLDFGGKIWLLNEAETLDQLNTTVKKKRTEIATEEIRFLKSALNVDNKQTA